MNRNITYRLIPGTKARAEKLSQYAGACRFVWNHFLAKNKWDYYAHRMGLRAKPSVSFESFGVAFTRFRDQTPWLEELPYAETRYALKRLADAYKKFFDMKKRGEKGGFPKFKGRQGDDSFTIPQAVKIRDGKIHVPKLGYLVLRRRGGNPYPDGKPKQAVIKRVCEKWYCVVSYETPDEGTEDNGLAVGVDMNCGQIAVSTGDILDSPERKEIKKIRTRKFSRRQLKRRGSKILTRLEARRKRYQRMVDRRGVKRDKRGKIVRDKNGKSSLMKRELRDKEGKIVLDAKGKPVMVKGSKRRDRARQLLAKTSRKIANVRANWHHHVSRTLANTAGCVVVEGLKVKSMTAKGNSQKKGLNREILRTGWGSLREKIAYKATEIVKIDPRYTSQTCRNCGHVDKDNRKSQADFVCLACGHESNADINAALVVQASGIIGASERRGALALAAPMNREYSPSILGG